MNSVPYFPIVATPRPTLALFCPPPVVLNVSRWRINGHPAQIILWTAEEFNQLTNPPKDAIYNACGVWCALRID